MQKSSQEKILQFIQDHLQERQIPPTLREIQEHCGFSAIGTVQYHLKKLVETGYLAIRPRLSRGISLTARTTGIPILGSVPAGPAQLAFEQLEGYLSTTFEEKDLSPFCHSRGRNLPATETLAGIRKSRSGGVESSPDASSAAVVSGDDKREFGRGLFALRIKGDSMIEAGILDGDLVIVRPQSSGKNGDIVVARIAGDEATVKRLVRKPGLIQLAPANPRYRPLPVDETVQILGKVIRVVRQYN